LFFALNSVSVVIHGILTLNDQNPAPVAMNSL